MLTWREGEFASLRDRNQCVMPSETVQIWFCYFVRSWCAHTSMTASYRARRFMLSKCVHPYPVVFTHAKARHAQYTQELGIFFSVRNKSESQVYSSVDRCGVARSLPLAQFQLWKFCSFGNRGKLVGNVLQNELLELKISLMHWERDLQFVVQNIQILHLWEAWRVLRMRFREVCSLIMAVAEEPTGFKKTPWLFFPNPPIFQKVFQITNLKKKSSEKTGGNQSGKFQNC